MKKFHYTQKMNSVSVAELVVNDENATWNIVDLATEKQMSNMSIFIRWTKFFVSFFRSDSKLAFEIAEKSYVHSNARMRSNMAYKGRGWVRLHLYTQNTSSGIQIALTQKSVKHSDNIL